MAAADHSVYTVQINYKTSPRLAVSLKKKIFHTVTINTLPGHDEKMSNILTYLYLYSKLVPCRNVANCSKILSRCCCRVEVLYGHKFTTNIITNNYVELF